MHCDKEDVCLMTHGREVPSDAAQERRSATEMVDIRLNYLAVGLDEHHSALKMRRGCLDYQLDTGELSSIRAHALL